MTEADLEALVRSQLEDSYASASSSFDQYLAEKSVGDQSSGDRSDGDRSDGDRSGSERSNGERSASITTDEESISSLDSVTLNAPIHGEEI